VVGGVRRRPEVAVDAAEADDVRDAETEACCARRVSRARPGLGCLCGTTVDPESQERHEEMEEPRWARPLWLGERGERREDLGICDNSPTKPGALAAAKSYEGLKVSIPPGVNE
jgi:hypothetical protein